MTKPKILAVFEGEEPFEITPQLIEELDYIQQDEGVYHVLHNGNSIQVKIQTYENEQKKFVLHINGKEVKLQLKEELDILIDQMGFKNIEEAAFKELRAPMPGLVIDVLTENGKEIVKGENLIILEAMKMENIIKADGHATVKNILVKAGDKVDKNQLLLELE
jgi:acetyl/propionyl-CoA carboxylase alpha subunit